MHEKKNKIKNKNVQKKSKIKKELKQKIKKGITQKDFIIELYLGKYEIISVRGI